MYKVCFDLCTKDVLIYVQSMFCFMYKVCFSCHLLPFLYLSSHVLLYLPLIKTTLILNERLVYEWEVQQHMRLQHKIFFGLLLQSIFCTKYVLIYV